MRVDSKRPTTIRRAPLHETRFAQLAIALEGLAFSMLDVENELFLSGPPADLETVAEWRREVRIASEVLRR